MAKQVQQLGRFDQMGLAMLHPDEIAEKVAWWERHFPEHAIIVAPLFLSEGYFTKKVIPQRLAGGRNIRYNGKALLPHDNITRWMERQIAKHF
jgi:sirohydrochlorin ferrochelatase